MAKRLMPTQVVDMLAADIPLPRRNFDHPLSGETALNFEERGPGLKQYGRK
jgi:hypothetical protein